MKKILIITIVILIVLFAFISFNSNKTEAPVSENSSVADDQSNEPVDITNLSDGTYSINTNESIINWTGKKTLVVDWIDAGTINIESGTARIEEGQVISNELIIDMNSISAKTTGSGGGQDTLSNHLKSDDFFNVENYPTSRFVATEFKSSAPNQFEIIGNLTIKDITNEIIVPITVYENGDTLRIVGSTDLDRTLWNIRYGSDKFFDNLGDNVIDDIINIDFELIVNKNEENTDE
jgi:polyisoprenoid-binding protein YceI